jgi:hypothetical protein
VGVDGALEEVDTKVEVMVEHLEGNFTLIKFHVELGVKFLVGVYEVN